MQTEMNNFFVRRDEIIYNTMYNGDSTVDYERYTSNKFKRKLHWNFNQIYNPLTQANRSFDELAEIRATLDPRDPFANNI